MRRLTRRPSAAERAEAAQAATAHLIASPELRSAERIALYAHLPTELSTRPLLEWLWRSGRVALLPRIAADGALQFVPVSPATELRRGRYGVLEPLLSAGALPATTADAAADLVLVPGLAFDGRGGRLGRGGGHYDRRFPPDYSANPPLLGFAFSFQLVERVPREAHDLRLDAVVTERGICRCP